ASSRPLQTSAPTSFDPSQHRCCVRGIKMRAPVYDLYQMKEDRLPPGIGSAWLRTLLNQPPAIPDHLGFVGKERHPSKWTTEEMKEKGSCYREIPSWLTRRSAIAEPIKTPAES